MGRHLAKIQACNILVYVTASLPDAKERRARDLVARAMRAKTVIRRRADWLPVEPRALPAAGAVPISGTIKFDLRTVIRYVVAS